MMVLRTALVVTALVTTTLTARAEDRSVLLNCKAMVERASKDTGTATEAELTRCRQIIREWALRDARTTVDEQGRQLK
ncbi:hypothetical protein [Bradyrhizobium japonicum]|uniref:hypothetical protein n=1 Tax=Bradyrhizobium japonicum TaxID=375 RepID=UPI002715355C|nr:hypothetical protein [Bradyrhizobium japonicum]WLB57411.1 hypothetical protein QIH94_15900 [Bradyrhizobium japonicum]WLB60694.1 hypothetical protein QIH96_29905 [Bradyrhizobium japonicum]